MSELKESFLADVVGDDYLPNAAGMRMFLLETCLTIGDGEESIRQEDWKIPKFAEVYKSSSEKSLVLKNWVKKNLSQQYQEALALATPKNETIDCLEIIKNIPELRQCLEYADYLCELFQQQIDNILNQLQSESNESLAIKAGELIKKIKDWRHRTHNFDPEKDPEYKKQLKKKENAEARPTLPEGRK